MKIAHISDLHFSHFTYSPLQFFSKRWLGNFNFLLSRKKDFIPERLELLPEIFQKLGVTHVVICGDLSTTAQKKEFNAAKKFVETLKRFQVVIIPGNHDHYTYRTWRKKTFYNFFPSEELKRHAIVSKQIDPTWWIIALDTALATSWVSSRGNFSSAHEAKLQEALDKIPDSHHVIVVNHFPFFQNDSSRKILVGGKELQTLLQKNRKVQFYLHGHTHRHCFADLRVNNLPIILDSGSTTHRTEGRWNLFEITPKGSTIDIYKWDMEWKKERSFEVSW